MAFRRLKRAFRKIRDAFKKVVKAIGDVITAVVTTLFSLVELIVGAILDTVAYVVGLIFSIPVIGRLLKWIWNAVLTLVWIIVGAIEWVLEQLGLSIEKKMRCCVIVLENENNISVLDGHPSGISREDLLASIREDLRKADAIFRSEANVRLVAPARGGVKEDMAEIPIRFHSNEGNTVKADASILDVNCDEAGGIKIFGNDLLVGGSKFELLQNRYGFENGYRTLVGLGSTVAIFVIRTVDLNINVPGGPGNDSSGCSQSFLASYVVVEPFRNSDSTIAHELGHACSLLHASASDNLMSKPRTSNRLNKRQRFFVRSSKNVSAF